MLQEISITHLDKPEGTMVFSLPQFPAGPETCLNFIPNGMSGIYAWFQSYKYSDDPKVLFEQLVSDIERPKFTEREGIISPYYHVGIRSFGKLSDGKRARMREALEDIDFRQHLHHAMGNSILFQSPLYVGKAANLKKRIGQHLSPTSPLRARLNAVGIELDMSKLMICPLFSAFTPTDSRQDNIYNFGDISESEIDYDDTGPPERYEELFEEIFSRLFSPQFSIKLG
jgi:hypothetical protein